MEDCEVGKDPDPPSVVLGAKVEEIESETPPGRLVNTAEIEVCDVVKPEFMPLPLCEVNAPFVFDKLLEEDMVEREVERDVKSDVEESTGVEMDGEGDPLNKRFDKVSDVEYVEAPGVRLLEAVNTDVTVAKEESVELAMLKPLVVAL